MGSVSRAPSEVAMTSRRNVSTSVMSPSQLNLSLLVQSLESTFPLIERWNEASSPEPSVSQLISRVQECGQVFFDTLKESTEIAEKSHQTARDMITLCECILAGESKKEIESFIIDMKENAKSISRRTKRVSLQFQSIRTALDGITNDVPLVHESLLEREADVVAKKAIAERRGQHCKAVKACSTAVVAVVAGVATVTFPPALLVVPIVMPLVILVTEVFDWKNSKQIKKRETQQVLCRDALQDLRRISKDLTTFGQDVDLLTDYWLNIDVELDDLLKRLDDFRGKERYRLKVISCLDIWKGLKEEYRDYAKQLKQMQAFYHHSLSRSSSSGHSIGSRNQGVQNNISRRKSPAR